MITGERKKEYQRDWAKSLPQYPKRLYRNLENRFKTKESYQKRTLCFTEAEFRVWIILNPTYHELHKDWIESGYENTLAPSIGLIDRNKDFTLDNIEILTVSENSRKTNTDQSKEALKDYRDSLKKRILCHQTNEVFESMAEAAKKLNVNRESIRKMLKGDLQTVSRFYTFERV